VPGIGGQPFASPMLSAVRSDARDGGSLQGDIHIDLSMDVGLSDEQAGRITARGARTREGRQVFINIIDEKETDGY
jgi:pentose-5-phosphate-3-epimerase